MSSIHKSLIEVKSAEVHFGTFHALRDISLSIQKGARIGLVGPNGAGKSTLLKLLAKVIHPDTGSVKYGDQVHVGYLPQIAAEDERVGEYAALSGGEKTKRILSDLFSGQCDVYLLDEPTNNLDTDGLDWLLHEVTKPSSASRAYVIVSHDRDFLDKVVNTIIEVDEITRTLRQFECTYSEYRDIKRKEAEDQWKDFTEATEEQKRLKKSTEQRGSWIRKIEQTRANNRKLDPGEKEKPAAAYLRDKEGRMGKRAKVLKDRVDKATDALTELKKPTVKLPINLEFENVERSGEMVFEVSKAVYVYENKDAVGPFNFQAMYGERIHVSGRNGSGKTTLIRLLLSEIQPTQGEIKIGARVHVGYLPQEDVLMKSKSMGQENIIDAVCRIVGAVRDDKQEGLLRMTLKRFGFEEDDAKKNIEHLSAGERSRLQLALMKLMKANCIILDEPTNHLDIECVEALEKALKEFEGTLIVVSHDRKFCERVGFTREFVISLN